MHRSTDHLYSISRSLAGKLLLCAAALLCATQPARAGWIDSLFGPRTESGPADAKTRTWPIHEFTAIALVPREAGAIDNQQPLTVQADALRQQLALVQANVQGARQPLFAADELADLVGPLAQALGRAGPGDDVLLLSNSRRGGGILGTSTAVTARLFVQGGSLQLIVHDARLDFYDAYRGTHATPHFTYGSRGSAGSASVQSSGATTQRADWLAIPLGALSGSSPPAASAAPAAPTAGPAPAAPLAAPAPPATAPPVRKPLDAAGAQDIERRLETLKRLRDKGLISEDEYQQKRKEILQLL